jgi:hypothetical protein
MLRLNWPSSVVLYFSIVIALGCFLYWYHADAINKPTKPHAWHQHDSNIKKPKAITTEKQNSSFPKHTTCKSDDD